PEEILDSDPAEANYGIAQMSEDDLFENAKWATEAGISVAIHAIGDQANHHVLNVFDRLRETTREAEQRLDRPLRHRVEHAQFIRAEDLARFAELDVIASMQPRHCISDLHLLHLIDESAHLAAYAWPDLLAAGAQVVFGSDGPVEPANPFAAIYAAMTRADISGDASTSFQPERRLSAVEAIRLHTQGPAFAAGLENRRGYLAAGMDADFIVVDTDPCAAAGLTPDAAPHGTNAQLGYAAEEGLFAHAEAIRDTRVVMTVVGGEVKYRACTRVQPSRPRGAPNLHAGRPILLARADPPPRRWAGPPRRRWAGISRETNVDLPASNLHSSPAESGSLTSVPVPSPTPFSAVARRSDVTAAGDLGDGAREVARQAGGEEQDHRGDLLRFTGTAQGDVGELRVDGVLRHGLRHRGVDEAGLDGIDADVLERDLLGHGLRHADDAGLRRRVV